MGSSMFCSIPATTRTHPRRPSHKRPTTHGSCPAYRRASLYEDSSAIDQSSQVCAFRSAASPNAALTCAIPFGPPSSVAQSTESNDTSWKATVDFDLTQNQLLYATVGTGYRGGGVSGNTTLPAEFLTYDPETVTNYELGWKSELLDRALGLTVSAFNMQYEDMQVSAIELDLNGNPTPVTVNAAKARIRGSRRKWTGESPPRRHPRLCHLSGNRNSESPSNGVKQSRATWDGIYNTLRFGPSYQHGFELRAAVDQRADQLHGQ